MAEARFVFWASLVTMTTNRKADGTLEAGDELVVMVTRDAQKIMRASATAYPARMKHLLCKNGSTPENAAEALQTLLEQMCIRDRADAALSHAHLDQLDCRLPASGKSEFYLLVDLRVFVPEGI